MARFITVIALLCVLVNVAFGCSVLSCDSMQQIVRANFPEQYWNDMLCIAFKESSYCPTIYNNICCYGLFQVHHLWVGQPNCPTTIAGLSDPTANARCASHILASQGITAWQTWTSGLCRVWNGCKMSGAAAPPPPPPAHAPPPPPPAAAGTCVTTASVNLRTAAGTTHNIIATIPSGSHVTDLGHPMQSVGGLEWRNIEYNGHSGWSANEYLSCAGHAPAAPPPPPPHAPPPPPPAHAPPPPPPATAAHHDYCVTSSALNLRSGAGTTHSVIMVIPQGATVTDLGKPWQSANNIEWRNIEYSGHSGWSSNQYLTRCGQPPPAPPPAQGPAPSGSPAHGVDVSQAYGKSTFDCLKQHGYSFVVVRCWESGGQPDSNCPGTVKAAREAGLETDVYLFPHFGSNAATQVQSLHSYMQQHGVEYGTVWMDIESPPSWGSYAENKQFLLDLVNAATGLGMRVGIYSSMYMWQVVMGSDSVSGFEHLPLWYAHYDGSASLSDFQSFGNWHNPAYKQYAGDAVVCGAGVDLNYRG